MLHIGVGLALALDEQIRRVSGDQKGIRGFLLRVGERIPFVSPRTSPVRVWSERLLVIDLYSNGWLNLRFPVEVDCNQTQIIRVEQGISNVWRESCDHHSCNCRKRAEIPTRRQVIDAPPVPYWELLLQGLNVDKWYSTRAPTGRYLVHVGTDSTNPHH